MWGEDPGWPLALCLDPLQSGSRLLLGHTADPPTKIYESPESSFFFVKSKQRPKSNNKPKVTDGGKIKIATAMVRGVTREHHGPF